MTLVKWVYRAAVFYKGEIDAYTTIVLSNTGGEMMSLNYYHNLCTRYKGRAVKIRTRDGKVHCGVIDNVNKNRVFLRRSKGARIGGFSYGYGGYGGYGRYQEFGVGIALGAIASLILLPFFFW